VRLRRSLIGTAISAAAFFGAAVSLAVFGSTSRHVTTLDVVALVAFVALTRFEYEVGVGSAALAQLAFVPLLFAVPLKFIPLAVGLGSAAATGVLKLRGGKPTLCPNAIGTSWFTLPPVLLLLATGEKAFSWHSWPLYAAAVVLQSVADVVPAVIYERIVNATPLRPLAGVLATVYGFDFLLTPIGLLIAAEGGWSLLAVLPFTSVLFLLSRERRKVVQLTELTHIDALTGAANRRAFDERLAMEQARATRAGSELSICLLDLDRLKTYNDTFGHPAGDELLCRVVAEWSAVLRPEVLLARIGGDEFGVIVPDASTNAAEVVVGRLRGVTPPETTFSAGFVTWDGVETMAEAIQRADSALYRAKDEGRNHLVLMAR
jgi:diguanylate cyclase (GGDEF)-like protein